MKKTIHKNKKVKELIVEQKPINLKNYYYILGIIVFFVFANTISGGYNLDDELVTMNHRFTSQGLTAVKDIFTNSYYADDMGYAYGYRPMVHLSFAVEHQFFGQSPKISHFFNVLLYVLSVVLFFKLLLKWFGVENLKLAFLAVILFAIHPVHTEVVASIKNRDEILAFLFIILTGLSMIKYLDKRKISSIVWIVVLFAMAMLSKKSAYPMAIVLPIAFILFQNLTQKQLAIISLSVIFPAAVIGSELNFVRLLLMLVLPIIGIGFVYFIKSQFIQKDEKFELKSLISKPIIPISIITIIAIWSIYTWNFGGLIFTIPFLFWLFHLNVQFGLILITLISVGMGERFGYKEFKLLPILITIGYGFYLFNSRKTSNSSTKQGALLWILLFITSLLIPFINSFKPQNLLLLINMGLFFWLLFKKPLWALLLAVTTLSISYFISNEISFYAISISVFSLWMYLKDKNKLFKSPVYFVPTLFSTLILFFSYENYQFNKTQVPIENSELSVTDTHPTTEVLNEKSFLKEGRNLEFAENTLVAPHTKAETIGTGAATLGEYIRLMVFPNELSFYYGFARMETISLSNPFVWISIFIHFGLILLAIWQLKKRPIISFGIIWYLLSIILFSNWIELVAGMVAERLLFIASAGFCIFTAGLMYWMKPSFLSKKPFVLEGIVAMILFLFVIQTIYRNSLWKDPITLMGYDIQHLENSAQANNLYALRLMEYTTQNAALPQLERNEIHQKVLYHFSNAIKIDSSFFNALFDKGRAAQYMGDTITAIETFKVAIQRQPDFLDSYQYLLMEYEKMEDWKNYLQTAKMLLLKNDIPPTYDFISKGFFMRNQADSSLAYINQGLHKFPGEPSLIERKKYLENVIYNR